MILFMNINVVPKNNNNYNNVKSLYMTFDEKKNSNSNSIWKEEKK